ncbi:MAG: bifunctional metallophosphatase/5'-nucleotidase [Deltaproteobacteria bacterium]|jgi:5'-nucleotidase|nr:bifunctional metallophosphatase/5'-nucleotidase [Deltaproteobacteria bacterium]
MVLAMDFKVSLLRRASFLATRTLALLALTLVALTFFDLSLATLKGQADDSANFALTFFHTNDLHASYGGFTDQGQICYLAICKNGEGGILRLQRAHKALKLQYPDSLLLDAGDQSMGTLFWRVHKENVVAAVLNALDYQFFVPGNHEFDAGLVSFKNLAELLKAEVISANLKILDPLVTIRNLKPYAIVEIKGQKVGLVGLTTAEIESYGSLVHSKEALRPFELADELESLKKAVKELTEQGVQIIVALTHVGYDHDLALAAQVEGLDVIVGGHSHTLLGEGLPKATGPYPTVVQAPNGQPVLVVSAGSHGRYLGRLTVDFNAAGRPIKWSGQPLRLDDPKLSRLNAPLADQDLRLYLAELALPIQNLLSQKIGQIEVAGPEKVLEANSRDCRSQECRSGDALTEALLDFSPKSQVALVNSGAIRNSLPAGDVSLGDVLSTFPFENYLHRAKILGEDLAKVLAQSGQNLERGASSRFLQVAGLRVTYVGQKGQWRLKEVLAREGTNWVPLDPKAEYEIVTLDFLADGGDGYEIFKKLKWTATDQLVSDIFVYYLEKGPVKADFEPRIFFATE